MTWCSVTDHAVLRYLERIAGIDVEAVRALIAAETSAAAFSADRAGLPGRFAIRTTAAVYVVDGGAVVTVLSRDMPVGHRAIGRLR